MTPQGEGAQRAWNRATRSEREVLRGVFVAEGLMWKCDKAGCDAANFEGDRYCSGCGRAKPGKAKSYP